MQTSVINPLLENLTKIYDKKDKLLQKQEVLKELSVEIESIMEFLELDVKMAILLSVMVCDQLIGESNSIKKNMRAIGFNAFDVINSHEAIKELKRKGWLLIANRRMLPFRSEEYQIAKFIIDAILYCDKSKLEKVPPKNLTEALIQIKHTILNLGTDFDVEDLIATSIHEINKYNTFPFLYNILQDQDLIEIEKIVLIFLASEMIYGKEEFDLSQTIEELIQDTAYNFWFKQRIVSEDSVLFKNGYLEFKKPNFVDFSSVAFSDKLGTQLLELSMNKLHKRKAVRYSTVIEPNDTKQTTLFFNQEMADNINQVDQLLTQEKLEKLMLKFNEHGMKECLTLIFHGLPGTGKTELVKQIAQKHQRSIFQVEIAGIKDLWVGESEKNLKKVFKEYAEAVKCGPNTPILLFNEADAILGQRTKVQHSVDQTFNALQNILLQELEDMKGIFIGTTNHINNIDGAFDRRFLYKLKFELPDEQTRFNILQHQFPEMTNETLIGISKQYRLSGGQIQNIKRKFIIDQVLFGNQPNNEDQLIEYVKSEVNFRESRISIGFNH
jgi:hypothetical protein